MSDTHQDPVASTSSSISTPQFVIPTVRTNLMDISLFVKRSLTLQEKFDILTNVWKLPLDFKFRSTETKWFVEVFLVDLYIYIYIYKNVSLCVILKNWNYLTGSFMDQFVRYIHGKVCSLSSV